MQSLRDIYDVVVVGAGIEGSATAYHLAKRGKLVLLLEQFPLPHSRGSSHGQSRITRKTYGDKDYYTEMMGEAFPLMEQLQTECEEELFVNCGCLILGPADNRLVTEAADSLRRYNLPHENLGSKGMKNRYPYVRYPDDYQFVLDKTGGILRADKMLLAFQNQFVRNGGYLHDGEPVLDITPGKIVSVKTTKRAYQCHSLVLTVGPWAVKMLPKLGIQAPLQPIRISACYWKEKMSGVFHSARFPAFTDRGDRAYGLPADEYPGLVKICMHAGSDIDPDQRDKADNSYVIERLKSYVAQHFPTLSPTPAIVESCIYTNTPDENFILDTHPAWKNIVIGAGFSGHGFKLSPVVGKILGQMALGETPSYDMKPFKLDRFHKAKM